MFANLITSLQNSLGCWSKRASGGRELLTRCKFCSDSHDLSHGHFYIKTVENKPITYHCVKCNVGGLLTTATAISWGITDQSFLGLLEVYNKKVLSLAENKKYMVGHNMKYKLDTRRITDSNATRHKIDYINRRLGTRLSYNDCRQMKIVPNILDLLQANRVRELTLSRNIIEELNNHFIGFLSYDGAFVNLRQVTEPSAPFLKDKRWINYNIFGKYDNCQRFYTIPWNVNRDEDVTIYVAEGVFDILSLRLNCFPEAKNAIFSTEAGNSYMNTVRHFSGDMGIIGPDVRFFYDNDVPTSKMIKVKQYFDIYCGDIKLIYNGYPGEKDFGISKDRIAIREFTIDGIGR